MTDWVLKILYDERSIVYDGKWCVCFQFGTGTEAPGNSNGINACIAGSLHVYSRVTNIQYGLLAYVGSRNNFVYYLG